MAKRDRQTGRSLGAKERLINAFDFAGMVV
jgi:hypothetical protein